MKTVYQPAVARRCRPFIAGLAVLALGACSLLRPTTAPAPTLYSLDNAYSAAPLPALAAVSAQTTAATLTLIINPPQAAAGFDSQRIIYVREPHKLDYFAHSQWVDPPARMLGPLLLAAIERSGAFRAVVLTPGAAAGDLRLDTEIIRLQHEFQTQPSRVRFTLRATLVENKTRHVLAGREFEAVAPASSDDPYGGVVAANQAVQTVLENLAQFLTERKQ
jgi:cholesterol transport system auxiliary component